MEEGKKGRLFSLEERMKGQQTLRERLGEDGYKAHMASIGARGGKKSVPKGFAKRGLEANELHDRVQKRVGHESESDT